VCGWGCVYVLCVRVRVSVCGVHVCVCVCVHLHVGMRLCVYVCMCGGGLLAGVGEDWLRAACAEFAHGTLRVCCVCVGVWV